jgi:hypothetical protein
MTRSVYIKYCCPYNGCQCPTSAGLAAKSSGARFNSNSIDQMYSGTAVVGVVLWHIGNIEVVEFPVYHRRYATLRGPDVVAVRNQRHL